MKALFDVAYSFRNAESGTVRRAVMQTMGVCIDSADPGGVLDIMENKEVRGRGGGLITCIVLFYEFNTLLVASLIQGEFERYVEEMEESDEEKCRVLAKGIKGAVAGKMREVLGMLGS